MPLIDDFGVDTHVASPNLAGWPRVTAAAISFPGGVERSHTQKRWRPGNAFSRKSLYIPSSVPVRRLQEPEKRSRCVVIPQRSVGAPRR